MKKLLCIALTLCLLLCGCGGSKDRQDIETAPAALQEQPETEAPAVTEPAPTEPAPTETEAPVEETQAERNVTLGRISGNEYINEYVGYGCRFEEGWDLYGADVLQELPGDVADLFTGTELGDKLSEYTQITDMLAENVDTLTTVNVVYTKLGLQERLAYALLDEKSILEQMLSQKDLLIESYTAAGIMVSDMELVTVNFLGQERYAIHTTATMQDVPYFILQVYDYHLGSYGVVTTFASFVEDNTAYLPALFYPLA